MLRSRFFRATLAVALAFAASSCDSADLIQAPTDAAPQFAAGGNGKSNAGGNGGKQTLQRLLAGVNFTGGMAEQVVAQSGMKSGPIGVAFSWQEGDESRTAMHTLYVAPGTVKGETLFRMEVVEDRIIAVDLSATSLAPNAEHNDVGRQGFKKPLELCLSVDAVDPGMYPDLGLAWDNDGRRLVPVPSAVYQVDGTTWVCGEVDHFSRFVVIHN